MAYCSLLYPLPVVLYKLRFTRNIMGSFVTLSNLCGKKRDKPLSRLFYTKETPLSLSLRLFQPVPITTAFSTWLKEKAF